MENNIQNRIDEFYKLSYEEKKEKLLNFISLLHDKDGYFSNLYQKIKDKKDITDNQMSKIYQYIIEYAQNLRNINKKTEKTFIDKLKEKINKLHEEELVEKIQEDPEKMMDNFLNSL